MASTGGSFGKNHAPYQPYEDKHVSVGSFDGGSCVGAHSFYYKQYDSCSYRWQAAHRATGSDRGLYGDVTSRYSSAAVATAKTFLRNRALVGTPSAVKVSNAGKQYMTVLGQPFRTGFAPWSNNAHHLLADAELQNGIFEMASGLPVVESLIITGLLDSKYNINLWKNMMILPQEYKVGCRLQLPTHPAGDSHPAYSAKVKARVDQALAPYKKVVKQVKQNKPHDVPEGADIADALTTLSGDLHAAVLSLRATVAAQCKNDGAINIGSFASAIGTKLGV